LEKKYTKNINSVKICENKNVQKLDKNVLLIPIQRTESAVFPAKNQPKKFRLWGLSNNHNDIYGTVIIAETEPLLPDLRTSQLTEPHLILRSWLRYVHL